MRSIIAILILLLISTQGLAIDIVENWECKDRFYGDWDNILVTAKADYSTYKGELSAAHLKHDTEFTVSGFNRRWSFDLREDDNYRYAFMIYPNGDALFYDFGVSGTSVPPYQFYQCRQTQE